MVELGPEGEFENKRLHRLVRLQQCDRGFFLLACHSYIESWLRQYLHMWEENYSFEDLIFKFKISLIESEKAFPRELSVLQNLRVKEKTALAVKHSFVEISSEEANAAAYRLLQFCSLAGIDNTEQLQKIEAGLTEWKERRLILDDELTELSQRLARAIAANRNLTAELESLKTCRNDSHQYAVRISELEAELKSLKSQTSVPAEQAGQAHELVRLMSAAQQKQAETDKKLAELAGTADYVNDLARITSYTRTRLDFERDVTRLTDEQLAVLECISLNGDFMVKGGAGTGKTLVLIKALEKALSQSKSELDFGADGFKARMLTYNRTLAKYDRYLADLLEQNNEDTEISTVDKFLYDKLRTINSDYKIIFDDGYLEKLIYDHIPLESIAGELTIEIVADELENTVFASDLSKKDYLNSKRRIGFIEKEAVWNIGETLIEKMKTSGAFSKNYSRLVILNYLNTADAQTADAQTSEIHRLVDTDFTFIDEIQDLAAVDIKTVKACTRRSLVMAGDSDQSIYREGFSFALAGIDIRGNTRILRTNFRNTAEIQSLAESYRLQSDTADTDSRPRAFRAGPPPEHCSAASYDELTAMIISRVKLFTEELKYDPENICILVPSSRDIEPLKARLKKHGFEAGDLRTEDFSFSSGSSIRISTMHSSKGLDFPVVLLNLHKLPQAASHNEKIAHNLIYVSMTRAMDHLNVFTLENEKSPEITGLVKLFE